jgi:hypothetical protein
LALNVLKALGIVQLIYFSTLFVGVLSKNNLIFPNLCIGKGNIGENAQIINDEADLSMRKAAIRRTLDKVPIDI